MGLYFGSNPEDIQSVNIKGMNLFSKKDIDLDARTDVCLQAHANTRVGYGLANTIASFLTGNGIGTARTRAYKALVREGRKLGAQFGVIQNILHGSDMNEYGTEVPALVVEVDFYK